MAGAGDSLVKQYPPATHQFLEVPVIKMRPVSAIEVAPGEPTVLQPGGLHIMLTGLKAPLVEGSLVTLTLEFEKAGAVEVLVIVQEPAAMVPDKAPAHKHGGSS